MSILNEIKDLESRKALLHHPLLKRMRQEELSREQVAVVLGQWFHPLHYFPSFVSRYIGICPEMQIKTLMSKIVWEELGEGDPARAHESFFIDTMLGVGFDKHALTHATPFPATRALVHEYHEKSGNDALASLGYVYATEAADLLMVGSIGAAVRRTTGVKQLPWVDIHIKQEPGHSDSVDSAVRVNLTEEESVKVLAAASKMFQCWCNFFTDIETAVNQLEPALASA